MTADFRDPWRERMRLEEIRRREKYKARKERKVIPEGERMPWPEEKSRITPERAWSMPRG
jgi:hypothetical protein